MTRIRTTFLRPFRHLVRKYYWLTGRKEAYTNFMMHENPMGLEEDFTLTIKSDIYKGAFIPDKMYDLLVAIYRFKEGDNRLTFM